MCLTVTSSSWRIAPSSPAIAPVSPLPWRPFLSLNSDSRSFMNRRLDSETERLNVSVNHLLNGASLIRLIDLFFLRVLKTTVCVAKDIYSSLFHLVCNQIDIYLWFIHPNCWFKLFRSSLALLRAYFIFCAIPACSLTPFTKISTTTNVSLPEPSSTCWLSLPTEITSSGAHGAWTHAAGANKKRLLPKVT